MRILVACEESQAVTIACRLNGHEAFSCDILPCSGGHPQWHIQKDVRQVIGKGWDLLIAFPPCTDIAVSGAKHFAIKRADGRQQAAIKFFMLFADFKDCPVVIENPVGVMSTEWRKPDQIIQPWQFGDPFEKTTCIWIGGGLPHLQPTDIVKPEKRTILSSGKSLPAWYNLPPSPERGKLRSKTFPGIAEAMADQWAPYSPKNSLK